MQTLKNDYEAFVLALELSVTAPNKKESLECLRIAEGFIDDLSEFEIAKAKKEVEIKLNIPVFSFRLKV